jgi:hypothetical protein
MRPFICSVLAVLFFSVSLATAATPFLDDRFNSIPGASGTIYCLATQADRRILIGGEFTTYNNFPRNSIARLSVHGDLDVTFQSPIAQSAKVYAMAVQPDGKILVGGDFRF